MVITWNENFRKLTTSDQNGLIIVWMLHRGIWFEEMINNRNRSVVRDMKWSADCQKICIIYEDGAVIVGTVDGQRLWGKEVKTQLAFVEWSPDGKNILFCTLNGEVHVYDNEGIYSHKVPIYCLDSGTEGTVAIAGIDWFAGPSGPDNQTPALCLGFENGRVQIMRSDADDKPVLLDTQLRCTGLKWDPNGSVVAIAGIQAQGASNDREVGIVQFYAPSGQHLRSLRVPGQNLRAISWEGSGLRLALAVDSHIFFANIRPDYLWGYFSHTLVYAVLRKERNEHVVVFWDTHTDEKYTKYIKHVTHIRSSEEYCVLVTKADDSSGQHIVIVCNDIGSPVDSKYMQLEPMHVAMTNSHVIATSEDVVYIWNYRSSVSRQAQGDLASAAAGMKQRRAEMMFHIDESFAPGSGTHDKDGFVPPSTTTQDPIACICATEQCLLVARESGVVQRYALPHLALEARFTIRCRPQVIAANCESTRMSVIDINGVLLLFDIEVKSKSSFGDVKPVSPEDGPGKQLDFERKDVWNMRWATDNPDLFAIMEKTRMYIVRGLQPEEPVLSNAYICAFKDLQIQSVLIDEVIQNPENPRKEVLLDFETKSLRDTRDILTKVSNLKDAFNYVDANPHPRLWRLLAEAALEQLEFSVAEKAFVRFEDYQGIQLVKRLRLLDDRVKQKAEVAAYFQRFDEAESLYREIDRKDLAIDLRVRLGDWFRVIQLAHGANEDLLHQAWSAIGDYYADRCKWHNAANYYAKAGNNAALVDTYYFLEDYDALERVIPSLPEGSPLLTEVGNKFASVGLCEQAVAAFLRHGDVKTAVDTCVLLNQWELAVNLAQQHNFQQIEGLLAKYAQHLLDKNKKIEAVQLYRKASRHTEGLQEVYWSIARPGGLRDSFRGWAATLMHPRRSSNSTSAQAQAMLGLGQVLIQLQNAITPEHQAAKAITALSEELRNPRSQPILEQLGPLRLLRTSSTSMTWMLAELRSEYKKKEFQVQYKQIGTKRPLFVLEIQSKILPKYGFSGDAKGVLNMKMEVALLSRKDRMIWKLMMDIHKLLDLPDSAAAEILTLDFGAANQVEHEVTSVYQQALQLTTFEKLVAARLHRQRRSLSEGLELLWMRLADPLQPAPVSLRELAAFGAASRKSYVLTGASRRRFALDVLSAACGVIATGKALQIVRKLCLDAHPAVVAKSEAVDLVECELPRCFQQPEVNAAPLLLRWQRGDRDIDATEESGVSALHLAAGDNHGPLLSALLILNANRDVRDHLGRTAAHWAASRAQPCLVLLQRAGFDLRAPDLHGRTPLAIARMNGMILQD